MKIKEHEYCLRCGRKLKNPKAREIGYGKICFQKVKAEKITQLRVFTDTTTK